MSFNLSSCSRLFRPFKVYSLVHCHRFWSHEFKCSWCFHCHLRCSCY